MKKIERPDIYRGFPEADYYADPCPVPSLTQSIAKVLINQSHLHAKCEHPRLAPPLDADDEEPEKYVKAQAIGNAVHATMIGRGKALAIGDFDNWKTKVAGAFKDEAITAGKTPILRKHMMVAHEMVLAAKLQLNQVGAFDPLIFDAFVNGDGEVVIAAEDNGIWMRSLIDWRISPTAHVDFKTTGMSVAPHAIPNLMADAGWPIQAAMQERILDLIDAKNAGRRRFIFVAQENYKPYALTVHELPDSAMTMGRKMVAKAEAMWREAMGADRWPGYAPVIHKPEYPGWKESQYLNREIAEAAQERVPLGTLRMAG